MKTILTAAMVCTVLVLFACAGAERKSGELPFPAKRLSQKGFSFVPPNEPYWVIVGRNDSQLLLARQRTLTDETVSVMAVFVDLPETASTGDLVRHVRTSDQQAVNAPRYRVREHQVDERGVSSAFCVRSYMLVEDHEGERMARTIGAVMLETLTLICPHPADRRLGVSLSYSHRFHPEDRDRQLIPKGNAMFESLEFRDL
ncbi:MAG TPA: hypothetical protein VMP00_02990 [Burkholderiales bacterium]|nr:hypothetical protein [Burkholderiales bacterium]